MSDPNQRSQVTVRLDADLLRKISAAAAEDRRPVSQYVRNLITDALEDRSEPRAAAGGR
jgi:hypothetical protein